jgi:hypothetical protein
MDTLIHADIFFFITSIWVVIISAFFVIILWNVAYIVNDLRHISRKIREGGDALSEDLHDLRATIHADGANVNHVWKYFKHLFSRRRDHKK